MRLFYNADSGSSWNYVFKLFDMQVLNNMEVEQYSIFV